MGEGGIVKLGFDVWSWWQAGDVAARFLNVVWMNVRLDVLFHVDFGAETAPAVGQWAAVGSLALVRSCVLV